MCTQNLIKTNKLSEKWASEMTEKDRWIAKTIITISNSNNNNNNSWFKNNKSVKQHQKHHQHQIWNEERQTIPRECAKQHTHTSHHTTPHHTKFNSQIGVSLIINCLSPAIHYISIVCVCALSVLVSKDNESGKCNTINSICFVLLLLNQWQK